MKEMNRIIDRRRAAKKNISRFEINKNAEIMYRNNARRDKNINYDVLSCKISALIYASTDRFYFSDEDAVVAFGSCLITFSKNMVTDIRWCNESHRSYCITDYEMRRLHEANEYFGLNKSGNDFASKEALGLFRTVKWKGIINEKI